MNPLLFIAMDNLNCKEKSTLKTAKSFLDVEGNFGFKINLDYLLTKSITNALNRIQQFDRPVFADLKMWNGQRTMIDIVKELVDFEVEYLNVYALADTEIPEVVRITSGTNTKVLGLTVLSHYDDDYCNEHFKRSLKDTVKHFTSIAIRRGCHGIILPGTALESVRNTHTIKLVPGIRPSWYKDTRHKEEVTPTIAIENGANILVCGSPIMKTDEPAKSLRRILDEMIC